MVLPLAGCECHEAGACWSGFGLHGWEWQLSSGRAVTFSRESCWTGRFVTLKWYDAEVNSVSRILCWACHVLLLEGSILGPASRLNADSSGPEHSLLSTSVSHTSAF